MSEDTFNNASRKAIRVLLYLCAAFFLIGLGPLAIVSAIRQRHPASSDSWALCVILAAVFGALGIAMLLSALLTIPTARLADRSFNAFRKGDLWAKWDYPADFWNGYIQFQSRQWRKSSFVVLAIIFVPIAGMALWISYAVPIEKATKIKAAVIALGVTIIVAYGTYLLTKWIARGKIRALTNCPHAYLGATAVYCGGTFNFWGSQLRGLQSASIIPAGSAGDPARLVVVVGLSKGIRSVAKVADVAGAVAMRPMGVSNYTVRQEIPILPGQEAIAREIVAKWLATG